MHITAILLVLSFTLIIHQPAQTNALHPDSSHALTISPEDYFAKYSILLKSSKDHTLRLHQSTTLTETAIAVIEKWIIYFCPWCTSTTRDTYHWLYYHYIHVKLETRYYLQLLLDLLQDLYRFFKYFDLYAKTFDARPNYEAVNKPDHAKNINAIISRLSSQQYDARIIQRRWVNQSFAFGKGLVLYLENQATEWNKLIEEWTSTTTKHDENQAQNQLGYHQQKLDLLALSYEWKMMNHSITQLYKHQYRQILNLKITRCTPAEQIFFGMHWDNTDIFEQLCAYLNSIQSANLYDTQFILVQNLKLTHNDIYLKIYNSYATYQNPQLSSFRIVSKINIEEWKSELALSLDKLWKDGPSQTLPFWFLKTASYWEIIKFIYKYLLDCIYEFFCTRLENYAAIQKRILLLNLNVALENL